MSPSYRQRVTVSHTISLANPVGDVGGFKVAFTVTFQSSSSAN